MSEENPYASPTSADTEIAHHSPVILCVVTGILLLVGACFLLLMNGQHFTNRLIFLGFVSASGLLWLRFRVKSRSRDPNAGRFALLIHLILLVAFAATLPDAYSRQSGFNNVINQFKTQSQTATP